MDIIFVLTPVFEHHVKQWTDNCQLIVCILITYLDAGFIPDFPCVELIAMPPVHSKSGFKKPKFRYSEAGMKGALIAVKNGMCITEFSRTFAVLCSTLTYQLSGKSPVERRMGPQSVLSKEQETL